MASYQKIKSKTDGFQRELPRKLKILTLLSLVHVFLGGQATLELYTSITTFELGIPGSGLNL